MREEASVFFQKYFKGILALLIAVCLIRFTEYFYIASKSFVNHTYLFEMAGWIYDAWACLIYGLVFLLHQCSFTDCLSIPDCGIL